MRELKPPQAEAAYTLDRHISVTAGPGAGKTLVLVERYLHILRTTGASVDQIVAITFTNRAANEMRARLRDELDRLLRSATPEERKKWMRHKRTLDGAVITTIHGFCARLLREFPVEADVDPQFALLNQHQSALLEERVVEEALTSFIDSGHEAITWLAAGIGRSRLAQGLTALFRTSRNQGLSLDEIARRTAENHTIADDYRAALDELNLRMSEFLSAQRLSKGAESKRLEVQRDWPRLKEVLFNPSSSSLADYCQAIEEFRDARPTASGSIGNLVKELDELIWKPKLGGRIPQLWVDQYARLYSNELIEVLVRIEQRMHQEKRRMEALDFDDLQSRALKLLKDRPEVLQRAARRYRFFLVDEFQDTNALQRDLMAELALGPAKRANLFIVGDPKQSIYGFRGADVDVFRQMTAALQAERGEVKPLNLNFRSQPPLIAFFNLLFRKIFVPADGVPSDDLDQLGFVEHEDSQGEREGEDEAPLVELLIDLRPGKATRGIAKETPRERDAEQLARRIRALVEEGAGSRRFAFRDFALLFRAMTEAWIYESALRRAGIPYLTVQGKGFYEREEISDLVNLLRFLDNRTDELALAAVLRSPLCGISDDTLLALRCAPAKRGMSRPGLRLTGGIRGLLNALGEFEHISHLSLEQEIGLSRSRRLLSKLSERNRNEGLADLLRFAVESSEFKTVIAATFDGAQRLANVEKLFSLAESFERSGAHTIRDFARYIRDFEAAGGRESEGQKDDSADAVRLMSIHQSKGLEFPVVVIPDLHRQPDVQNEWHILDRHRGLTLKIPDGRGWRVAGYTMTHYRTRAKLREQFEGMRLLYVAATRARDRLILSGAAKDLKSGRGSWLGLIAQSLELDPLVGSGVIDIGESAQIRVTRNLLDEPVSEPSIATEPVTEVETTIDPSLPTEDLFPLLRPLTPRRPNALHRFSVTQLLNYRRCPRQYYFDRVMHAPSGEETSIWNDAEAPDPPANLNATLRGAVIHKFCETYLEGDPIDCLRKSLDEVLRLREAELGSRMVEIDRDRAIRDLKPLTRNYLASKVRQRVDFARETGQGREGLGVLSEQRFRLRRPLGVLTGTIDKLLVREAKNGLNVEIIDFKTNRFRSRSAGDHDDSMANLDQLSFMFAPPPPQGDAFIHAEADAVVADYELQMQAYALAALELISGIRSLQVTFHFLDPDVEKGLPKWILEREVCANAIDRAMSALVSAGWPADFEANPAARCRTCSFQELCQPGLRWLGEHKN